MTRRGRGGANPGPGQCRFVTAAEPGALPATVGRPGTFRLSLVHPLDGMDGSDGFRSAPQAARSDLAEQAVARVAEPGHDVTPVIEPFVHGRGHYSHPRGLAGFVGTVRGEGLLDMPQAFG